MRVFSLLPLAFGAVLCALVPPISAGQATAVSITRMDPALDQLIAPGVTPELLAGGFTFVEGPMWREGRLWFADEGGDVVHAMTADGKVSDLLDYRPMAAAALLHKVGPNGMAPARDGSVVEARQYLRDVVKLTEKNGTLTATVLFDHFEGKHLNSPNDVVFARDGSFYFTDPPYGLAGKDADPAKEMNFNGVFHVEDGRLTPVVKDLTLPNGIALSPDGKTLYVANSGPAEKVMQYPVKADGTAGTGTALIEFPNPVGMGIPDGLKVDTRGNIWATGPGGIRVITPEGKVLGQIVLPETAANLAFGPDGQDVYITARKGVYRVRTKIKGLVPAFSR